VELLRFTTCGSVDDGKSTLIGRLLYDSKSIFEDQYQAIADASERRGEESINLALLTDGLKAEREQGITIDVAYRYFATPKRKFIIADSPGHIQYTRNMVTGASTANLAIILVDARNGLMEQTKRHAYIASLLQIPHLVVCINKMDLVDYSQERFLELKKDFENEIASKLDIKDVHFIPISAFKGDNVVNRSEKMTWYDGPTLMHTLEHVHIGSDKNMLDLRFPVQLVIRPNNDQFHDYRAYSGRVASGMVRVGDELVSLPSGLSSKVTHIDFAETPLQEAFAGQSVSIRLNDNIDISRGNMLVRAGNQPQVSQTFTATICWFSEQPLNLNQKFYLKHTTQEVRCLIKSVQYKVNINELTRNEEDKNIEMNDIAKVQIHTTAPLFFDLYRNNRITGSFILIEEGTNKTIAAGMIQGV
jgi:sulfate adenylyltransferase subunit 1